MEIKLSGKSHEQRIADRLKPSNDTAPLTPSHTWHWSDADGHNIHHSACSEATWPKPDHGRRPDISRRKTLMAKLSGGGITSNKLVRSNGTQDRASIKGNVPRGRGPTWCSNSFPEEATRNGSRPWRPSWPNQQPCEWAQGPRPNGSSLRDASFIRISQSRHP